MRFRPRVLGTATALLLGLCLALVPVANGTATGTTAGTGSAPVMVMNVRHHQAVNVRYTIGWHHDPGSPAPVSVEVQRRARSYSGGIGLWDPVDHRRNKMSTSYRSKPGRTTCFRVRGTGPGGEVGAWSAPACVTTPVDDHRFHIGALWDTDRDLQHYKHTITRTRHRRAVLRLADVKVRNLWLLYDRLPSGGSVAVYLNKRHLANVDLAGSHQFRVRVLVEGFERARRGTLRIVVRSSRRDVRIDGAYAMP